MEPEANLPCACGLRPSPISYSEVPVPPAETSHTHTMKVAWRIVFPPQWVPFRAVLFFRRQGNAKTPPGSGPLHRSQAA